MVEKKGKQAPPEVKAQGNRERWRMLRELEHWLELPVAWLSLAWLILLVVELIWGLNPVLNTLVYVIWAIFLLDFGIRFFLAPEKLTYLKRNWLTVISLALPALRVFSFLRYIRLLRLARSFRSVQILRVIGSINRGMRTLRAYLGRRRFGYVVALTGLVLLAGSAGMWALENNRQVVNGFNTYGEAVWWTAMILTTLGSQYWPQTGEGRLLAFLLALYAFSVFGYVTATLATFFIGQEGGSSLDRPGSELRRLESKIDALQVALEQALSSKRDPTVGTLREPPDPSSDSP